METSYVDAAESNAGDDFHILWAVRKSLQLLNSSKDGLKAVAVEDISSYDKSLLSADKGFLGVDLTEYYGGDSIVSASRIVVSQLKYSTRNPNLSWTAARICRGKKSGTTGSIIERLSQFFKKIMDEGGQDISSKVILKLVSNQPIDIAFSKAINNIQSLLINHKANDIIDILHAISVHERDDLDRIKSASVLAGQHLVEFIKSLDFSDCGAGSRFYNEAKLLKAITEFGDLETKQEYAKLKEFLRTKTMPENRGFNVLKATDILYQFGYSDLKDLFPVPQKIEITENLVTRGQASEITGAIVEGNEQVICVHGAAGIGKTTLMAEVSNSLPEGSIKILYDCYGGGTYLDSDDKRHKCSNAYKQISNELAELTGCAYLLINSSDEDRYVNAFKKRLELACANVEKTTKDGVVVIFIDAADNSVTAAQSFREASFIESIINITLPKKCKIVVSTRTERLSSLNLRRGYRSMEILPFTKEEAKILLLNFYPKADDKHLVEFYHLTGGIPRVMMYALNSPGKGFKKKITPLLPNGKSLNDIFEHNITFSERKIGNPPLVTKFLTYLISLPRPVPLEFVSETTGISNVIIRDIITDLWQGIVFENSSFTFRDEDFESYLRANFQITDIHLKQIADTAIRKAEVSEYASIHLGNFLLKASLKEELLSIVINRTHISLPLDPIRNKETYINRTRLSMQSFETKIPSLNFLKLQIIAAESAKANRIIEEILLNHPELANAFGNLQTNKELYFNSGNPAWFGPIHFRSAAFYSREKESRSIAIEHLKKAMEWLRYRGGLNETDKREYTYDVQDIAHGAEAILRIYDIHKCKEWLERWTPSFAYKVIEELSSILSSSTNIKQINFWLSSINIRIDVNLVILKSLIENGHNPLIDFDSLFKKICILFKQRITLHSAVRQSILCICEYALNKGIGYDIIRSVLKKMIVPTTKRFPHLSPYMSDINDAKDFDSALRKACIESMFEGHELSPINFYPESISTLLANPSTAISINKDEKEKFDKTYPHLISLYKVRLKFILNRKENSKSRLELENVLGILKKDWELSYRWRYEISSILNYVHHRLLDIIFFTKNNGIPYIINNGFSVEGENDIDALLITAKRLVAKNAMHPTVIGLLKDAEVLIDQRSLSGDHKLQFYTRIASIAHSVSYPKGKYYFDKMVSTSNDIDEEAIEEIKSFAEIVGENSFNNSIAAAKFANYVEYCSHRIGTLENYPWDEAIDVIGSLDIMSLPRILTQWDHRNIRAIDIHTNLLIENLLKHKLVDHIVGGALLPLNGYYGRFQKEAIKLILDGYDKTGNRLEKTEFVKDIIREIKLCVAPDKFYLEFIQQFNVMIAKGKFLDKAVVLEFKDYLEKLESLTNQDQQLPDDKIRSTKKLVEKNPVKVSKAIDVTNSDHISELFANYNDGYYTHPLVFQQLRKKVNHSNWIQYIKALANTDQNLITLRSLNDELKFLLTNYHIHIADRDELDAIFFSMLLRNTEFYFSRGYIYRNGIDELASIFKVDEDILIEYILRIIPEKLSSLSSTSIYQLLHYTTKSIFVNERIELLEWCLRRLEDKIIHQNPAFAANPRACLNSNSTISGLLRYILGHPDKRQRWRAANSIRKLAKFGNVKILECLLHENDLQKCAEYQDDKLQFFWLSAKLYLWVTIARISYETPDYLIPFANHIFSEKHNNALPHALIEYYVEQTYNTLDDFDPTIFSQFNGSNKNVSNRQDLICLRKGNRKNRKENSERIILKFPFNHLDTLPYWFDPLGSVFGISDYEIAEIAEKYIREYWGYTGDVRSDNHVKGDYHSTDNRQGKEPLIENLKTYYEYHAMFCAAGELRRTVKQVKGSDSYYTWDEWIRRWANCWNNLWHVDLRDPVPLEKSFWTNNQRDKDWKWDIQKVDFYNALNLTGQNTLPDKIPVYTRTKVTYGKDFERVSIRSGTVDILTAPSLLNALQTSDSLYSNIFYQDENVISNSVNRMFRVERLTDVLRAEYEGIDSKEESCGAVDKDHIVMSKSFSKFKKLQYSADYRHSRTNNSDRKTITSLERWGNLAVDRYDDFVSEGTRLYLDSTSLLDYLKQRKKCSIIECEIERYVDEKSYRDHYRNYNLFFLIYPNGKIETL